MLGTTPSSMMNFLIQTTSFIALDVDMYSTLVEKIYCGLLFRTLLTHITTI
jgi:hypothetical protein